MIFEVDEGRTWTNGPEKIKIMAMHKVLYPRDCKIQEKEEEDDFPAF